MKGILLAALATVLVVACGAGPAATTFGAAPTGNGSAAACTPVELRGPDGRQIDISGTWSGNDGGRYYIKQIDSCVWWSGLSDFQGQALGEEWIMTFRGTLDASGLIRGDFVDVKGTNPGSGSMTIQVVAEERAGAVVVELRRESVTGHQIGVTFWQRMAGEPAPSPHETGSASPAETSSGSPSETASGAPVTLPPP